ncbi:gluconate 2-dehydrogenase subunit 3 family protein [Pacificispira sp.]|uniref:gluconate 2-dehydrogenase subunit 3 family protein n=1 Tax=Pacificispira sp. TaxID=2888761 RepID=UPI003B51DF15
MRFQPDFETIPIAESARRVFGRLVEALIGRRNAMRILAASGLGLGAGLAPLPRAATASEAALEATLKAVVDTLVPADRLSPSAGDLDIHLEILADTPAGSAARTRLDAGCRWLDDAAGSPFAALGDEERAALLSRLDRLPSDDQSDLASFRRDVRRGTMRRYYARPEAIAGFASFDGPPQPVGYPDHDRPPTRIE